MSDEKRLSVWSSTNKRKLLTIFCEVANSKQLDLNDNDQGELIAEFIVVCKRYGIDDFSKYRSLFEVILDLIDHLPMEVVKMAEIQLFKKKVVFPFDEILKKLHERKAQLSSKESEKLLPILI